jgi:hypothetical protein
MQDLVLDLPEVVALFRKDAESFLDVLTQMIRDLDEG